MTKLLRVGVSTLLLTLLFWKTDWSLLATAFAGLRIEFWVLALGLLLTAQAASAWRWKQFADRLGFHWSLRQLTGFYFIGMYFNLMLPTSVGGDVIRACYVNGQSRRRLAAFASVLLERLNGLGVLVVLACTGVLCYDGELPPWVMISVASIAAAGCVGLLSLPFVSRWKRLGAERREQVRYLWRLVRMPRLLASASVLSLYVQAANVFAVALLGIAIGADVPLGYYFILVPMVSLLTLLPVSLNGMGIREGGMILFLAPLGVGRETALTLSFLWFAVNVACSLVGGFVYLFGRFPKPAASTAPVSDDPAGSDAGEESSEVTCGSLNRDSDQGRARQPSQAA